MGYGVRSLVSASYRSSYEFFIGIDSFICCTLEWGTSVSDSFNLLAVATVCAPITVKMRIKHSQYGTGGRYTVMFRGKTCVMVR